MMMNLMKKLEENAPAAKKGGKAVATTKKKKGDDDDDDDDAADEKADDWEKVEEEEEWDPDFDEFDIPKSKGKKQALAQEETPRMMMMNSKWMMSSRICSMTVMEFG